MPLPTDPAASWPPPGGDKAASQYREWAAWWSGDITDLAKVYLTAVGFAGPVIDGHERQALAALRPRMFHGSPAARGSLQSAKLHIPLASDIAMTSADLLFGEAPALVAPKDDPAGKPKPAPKPPAAGDGGPVAAKPAPTQERLDFYMANGLQAALLEGAEIAAAFGGVYLRVGWDTEIADHPLFDAIAPDAAVPEFRSGHLVAVTFHRVLSAQGDGKTWRHLERHEANPGRILHGLYASGDDKTLGVKMPLADHPDTKMFASMPGADTGIVTGAKGLAVQYVPNMRPNRRLRGSQLGRSDFDGIVTVLDALDEAWCADPMTEIMTARGWANYQDLRAGDTVLTLNNNTGLSEWQDCLEVCVFDAKPRDMISIENRSHSSLTTPNHRWPIVRPSYLGSGRCGKASGEYRDWALSDSFQFDDRVPVAADCADLPAEAKHTDALVEAVGWFWTEGHIRKLRDGTPGRNVQIVQSVKNVDHCALIRSALTRLIGPAVTAFPRTGKTPVVLPMWREAVNGQKVEFNLNAAAGDLVQRCAPGRVPTHQFLMELTKAQLELFLRISMLADNAGEHVFAQKDPAMAEAFQFAATLAGYPTSSYTRAKGEKSHSPGLPMHYVRLRSQRFMWPGRPGVRKTVRYDGVVWCPRTPNQTWLARRNGKVYFTGNTSWMRDLRLGKGRIVVPEVYLEAQGRGNGSLFDMEQEVFQVVNALPGGGANGGLAMNNVQFEIRVEQHQRTCAALTEQAVRGAGYSAQSFGIQDDGGMATATEVTARQSRSFMTRSKKINYWREPLAQLAQAALQIDVKQFKPDGVSAVLPNPEWPDGIAVDPQTQAQTLQLLAGAQAASIRTRVEMLHPDWDDTRVAEEVKLIEAEHAPPAAPEVGPPGSTVGNAAGGSGSDSGGEKPATQDKPAPNASGTGQTPTGSTPNPASGTPRPARPTLAAGRPRVPVRR